MKPRQSPECPLWKLPGELRNRIYELVVENDSDTIDITEAFPATPLKSVATYENCPLRRSASASPVLAASLSSAPPSAALMLTCQRLHEEMKGIFADAYQRYWEKSFVVDLQANRDLIENLVNLPAVAISTFVIKVQSKVIGRRLQDIDIPVEITLSRVEGQWRASANPEHLARDASLIIFGSYPNCGSTQNLLAFFNQRHRARDSGKQYCAVCRTVHYYYDNLEYNKRTLAPSLLWELNTEGMSTMDISDKSSRNKAPKKATNARSKAIRTRSETKRKNASLQEKRDLKSGLGWRGPLGRGDLVSMLGRLGLDIL